MGMREGIETAGLETSDAEAVERTLRGERDAYRVLVERHSRNVFRMAYRMTGNSHDAEEVVQEGFFNVWRNAPRYAEDRGSVRTWVLSIIHHQAIDKLRRSRSRKMEAQIERAGEVVDHQDVFQEVAASLERQRIGQALRRLPNEQRTTIELAYFGGYSHSEIAGLLRIPLGTVKGRLRLGMDKLRSLLAEPALELRPE